MTDKKPQLHQSDLGMFSRCQMQFMFRKGKQFGIGPENLVLPPGVAAAVGTATHRSVERNLSSMIATGAPLPLDEAQSEARDAFSSEWEGGLMLQDEEADNLSKTQGDAADQAVNLATLHHKEVAPTLKPIAVEKKFVIIRDNEPYDLSGQMDVVEERESHDGEGSTYNVLRDTKTTGKAPALDAAICPQMAMYSLSHVIETGVLPALVHLDILFKSKKPKYLERVAKPEQDWITRLLARVDRVTLLIDNWKRGRGAPAPANPDDWMCTKKWCGYTDKCPFWSGR